MERKAYPSDVSDDEWAFVAPYLTLMREDAPQRDYWQNLSSPGQTAGPGDKDVGGCHQGLNQLVSRLIANLG